MYAMETPQSDEAKNFVNIMQGLESQAITLTPKFQAITQTEEFRAITYTSQYITLIVALGTCKLFPNSKSYNSMQEALENLLETEQFQLLFKPGIFSDNMILKNNAMRETEAYQEYQGAKELHKECPTALPQDMVDYCKNTLRNTKEYEELLKATIEEIFITNNQMNNNEAQRTRRLYKIKAQDSAKAIIMQEGLKLVLEAEKSHTNDNTSQEYSSNVFMKNFAMQQTPEHQQYEQAKLAYEQNPNADTEYMLDLCKAELRNTRECIEFLAATAQEQHITDNITNSKKWEAEQPLSFQSIETLLNKRHDAWAAVRNTPEYQLFQQAKLDHERYNNEDSLFLLNEHQLRAKETREYKEYYKIEQELLVRTGESPKKNIYTIKTQPKTNNNNYAINNNNNNDDDNNTTTASSTTQSQAIETFSANVLNIYQTIKETPLYKEYQGAKQLPTESDSDDIRDVMHCGLEIFVDGEGLDLLNAIEQEKEQYALNNIIQSEKWMADQKYTRFPMLESAYKKCHLQVKAIDFLFDKLETQLKDAQKQSSRSNNNSNAITTSSSTQPQVTLYARYTKEWLQAKIERNEKKKNNAWNAYIKTEEYQLLEKKPSTLHYRRAYSSKESQEYRRLNAKLASLQQKLQKHDYFIPEESHQNQLKLSNNNTNDK